MKVGFLRAMIREVQWLTSNMVLDSVQSEMAIYPDFSVSKAAYNGKQQN